ncbi:MAG: hypothetical protein ACP5O6_12645 [Candidatus Baltobacteraceae bacterium]
MITTLKDEIAARWASEVNAILDASNIKQAVIAREVGLHNVILGRYLRRTGRVVSVPTHDAKKINAAIARLSMEEEGEYLDSILATDELTTIEHREYEKALHCIEGYLKPEALAKIARKVDHLSISKQNAVIRAVAQVKRGHTLRFIQGRKEKSTLEEQIISAFSEHGIDLRRSLRPANEIASSLAINHFVLALDNMLAETKADARARAIWKADVMIPFFEVLAAKGEDYARGLDSVVTKAERTYRADRKLSKGGIK